MVYICKPSRLSIYVNTGRKTASQIKAETGCTALINGGLFNMSTYKPVCHLKVDGKALASDQYKYWGFAWNDADSIALVEDYSRYGNYICCVCIVRDGKAEPLYYESALGGARQRTALGVFEDGRVWLYADKAGKTPEQLREIALRAGVKHAIMLDGGGSTQGISPSGTVTASRIVQNYICVWEGDDDMAIKIGHASSDEEKKASGGKAGDQTGAEVCTRSWYSGAWNVVLRPKNAALAEKSAQACEAACKNNNIGYDQGSRNTLHVYATLTNFDLAAIEDKCECDCSSLMHVCAIAGGARLKYGINGVWTGNMVSTFVASGDYEKLTDSKYLTSDTYLKRGDILVRESGHTAMVLENGGVSTVAITVRVLKKGHKGDDVKALQILLNGLGHNCGNVDGDFGSKTDKALKAFQKKNNLVQDGICGKATWAALLAE